MGTLRTDAALPGAPLLSSLIAAIFLSAALLFAVEPMFTKMVLPRLGGTPQVWSVAMVFFQTALLAGYGYAHLITRYLPGRPSIVIQLALLVVASFTLPLSIASGFGRPPAVGEAFWLLGLFAASIGLPFFALGANAPLLQAWFARSGHPSAGDPYFLYAASNVGSFLALLAYPLAIEPLIRLGDQTRLWSIGFYVLILLITASGRLLWSADRAAVPAPPPTAADAIDRSETAPPTWRDTAAWTGLAAVPSGLLIAVTAHISTDIAASPMLWVVPLALYLATFIIVFQTRPLLPHRWIVHIEPAFIILLVAVFAFAALDQIIRIVAANIVGFFVIALVCHGELARRRPAPVNLTAFYLWMSTGGMIGGISAGLIAPHLFSWVAEYPILIVLAALCRPGVAAAKGWPGALIGLALAALALVILIVGPVLNYALDDTEYNLAIWTLLGISVLFWIVGLLPWRSVSMIANPLPFATVIALTFAVIRLYEPDAGQRDYVRSFFGVHKIVDTPDGQFRVLLHGTTEHGAQRIRD